VFAWTVSNELSALQWRMIGFESYLPGKSWISLFCPMHTRAPLSKKHRHIVSGLCAPLPLHPMCMVHYCWHSHFLEMPEMQALPTIIKWLQRWLNGSIQQYLLINQQLETWLVVYSVRW
jgi:hypothetical protein